MSNKVFKDCLGVPITVGSRVAAPATAVCIHYLKTGTVTGFDRDKILITWEQNGHYMSGPGTRKGFTRLPLALVVIGAPGS